MWILVLYGTSEGQTLKIARFLADRFHKAGAEVELVDADHQPPGLKPNDFNAVVVAARVHVGRYPAQIVRFAKAHRTKLAAKRNAFLSVSMAAARLEPGDAERAEKCAADFVARTGWRPARIEHVAGARLYSRHGAVGRWILGLVDRHRFDTRRDHEWTDWAALERFAGDFLGRPIAVSPKKDLGRSSAMG
jgi:menaquinone-dependent protoporphyrinogen oxidase